MLLNAVRFSAASLLVAGLALSPSDADAQRVRVGVGFGGVRVGAPGVSVGVRRFGGVRVHTPATSVYVPSYGVRTYGAGYYGPGGYYYSHGGPRGVVRGSYHVSTPGYNVSGGAVSGGVVTSGAVVGEPQVTSSTAVTTTTARPTLVAPPRFASEAELAAMSGPELLGALDAASTALFVRLDSFTNGQSWKTYFALDAAAAGDLQSAEKLLVRFDSVARDAKFTMISEIEEFSAVRLALRMLVERGGVAVSVQPVASTGVAVDVTGESLPVPGVDVDVQAGSVDVKVERSVLAR